MAENKKTAGETAIQTFNFNPNLPIRVETIGGEPWFVAKDLCEILELEDVRRAVEPLDDDEKLTGEILQSGQNRKMWLVNESGMYALVIRSRKPEAKAFRRWVTSEVLPSIRKTGKYELPQRLPHNPRERSAELGTFYRELRLWVRKSDVSQVVNEAGVSEGHVMKVMRGTDMSVRVLRQLVVLAASNRAKGLRTDICRCLPQEQMRQLALNFMEEGGEL